jgi:dCMP deaminase
MKTAETFAECSTAIRLHVGAIVVKDDRIISIGYNGMPSGWDNNCEDKIYCDDGDYSEQQYPKDSNIWKKYKLVTKPEVLHAETNAIAKLAKSNESGLGATMFITHAPCLDCAKLVYQSGINTVYYRNSYRNEIGIQFLEKAGVTIEKI